MVHIKMQLPGMGLWPASTWLQWLLLLLMAICCCHWPGCLASSARDLDLEAVFKEQKHVFDELKLHKGFEFDKRTVEEMSLDFLLFTQNDKDSDHHLDGLEMMAAVLHKHDHEDGKEKEEEAKHQQQQQKKKKDPHQSKEDDHVTNAIVELIDGALDVYDTDIDGYLCYAEFKRATKMHQLM